MYLIEQLWRLPCDWSQPVNEKLEYATQVHTSEFGAEQRVADRTAPRRYFEFSAMAHDDYRTWLDLVLMHKQRDWLLPIFPDQYPISVAEGGCFIPVPHRGRDFHLGGLAVVRGPGLYRQQIVTIMAILEDGIVIDTPLQADYLHSSFVIPLRRAQLSGDVRWVPTTDTLANTRLLFILTELTECPSPVEMDVSYVPWDGGEHRGDWEWYRNLHNQHADHSTFMVRFMAWFNAQDWEPGQTFMWWNSTGWQLENQGNGRTWADFLKWWPTDAQDTSDWYDFRRAWWSPRWFERGLFYPSWWGTWQTWRQTVTGTGPVNIVAWKANWRDTDWEKWFYEFQFTPDAAVTPPILNAYALAQLWDYGNVFGVPVLDFKPDWSQDLTATYTRFIDTVDNGRNLPLQIQKVDYGLRVQSHSWFLKGAEEKLIFRTLLQGLRGRQRNIWVPSFSSDLQPVALVDGLTFDCKRTGYANLPPQYAAVRRVLMFELVTGQLCYNSITSCTLIDEETERFTLSSSMYDWDSDLIPGGFAYIAKISFMDLMRCTQDLIEIVHETDIEGLARCAMTFITAPDLWYANPNCPLDQGPQ